MDDYSTLMVKRYFREYYFLCGEKIEAPSELGSREFGYTPFGGVMIRHLCYKDIGTFRAILVKEAPAGVYCSNSLYLEPSAEMHLKGWKQAELIFDIDADGLKLPCRKIHNVWLCKGCGKKEFGSRPEICPSCRGSRILELPWTCRNCLEGTKKETMKLLDFLEFDLGIPPVDAKVYFSGSAGYHIKVNKSQYDGLDSHGRAELSDYLTGRGLTYNLFGSSNLSPNDPGWRGRFARFIRDLSSGESIFKSSTYESRLSELTREFSNEKVATLIGRAVSEGAVKIDAMVTTDVHRIFRMPETLNNKTGLVKRECTQSLNSFDPSFHPIALPDGMAKIMVDIAPKLELGGKQFGPFRSESVELPTYVGVYLVLKGAGKFVAEGTMTN